MPLTLALLGAQAPTTQGAVETLTALLGVALVVALLARRLRFPYTLALAIVGLALGLAEEKEDVLPQFPWRHDQREVLRFVIQRRADAFLRLDQLGSPSRDLKVVGPP